MNVAILGASPKAHRFSYRALKMLQDHGHTPLPVTPKVDEIEGVPVYPQLTDIPGDVDTVTMYVNAERSSLVAQDILNLKPRRVIFNPGSENLALAATLKAQGVEVVEACTLVMLQTGKF